MINPKNLYILVYRSEHVHVEFIDGRVEGDLNKVIWGDIESIVFSLVSIFNSVGKAEAVSYYAAAGNDSVQIGKRIAVAIQSDTKCDIKLLTENFLNGIKNGDNVNLELFNPHSCPLNEIAKNEVRSFLLHHGSKQIKQDLEIEVCGSRMKLAGRFGQIERNDTNLDEPPEIQIAAVNGLIKHNRTAYLKLASSKIMAAYFNQNDFLRLHSLLQSEEPQQFVLQQKYDAGGKKDWYLNSCEECSGEFLNFSA
jgi:hypothetical protein